VGGGPRSVTIQGGVRSEVPTFNEFWPSTWRGKSGYSAAKLLATGSADNQGARNRLPMQVMTNLSHEKGFSRRRFCHKVKKIQKELMKAKNMAFFDFMRRQFALSLTVCCAALSFLAGCTTTPQAGGAAQSLNTERSQPIVLTEGDTLKITFPSKSDFNTTQPIRRDGKLALPLVGEVTAAGKTPAQFEKELNELYAKQIVSSDQILVEIQSSVFPVFVTGAVQRPGKVLSDRPITLLQAILESGGFDPSKANLKTIRVLRNNEGITHSFTINLKRVMNGATNQTFYLKPYDIVYVPEKFSWL
jgi:polysaccharide biosynthesis/export protein